MAVPPSPHSHAPPSAPPGDGTPPPDAPPEQAAGLAEQARAEAVRLTGRYRRQLAPLAAIAATQAAGYAAATLSGAAALIPLAASAAVAAGGYAYARTRAGRWGRAYAALAGIASLGWQTVAALTGTGAVMRAVLWLGGAALALPWWVRHAEPTPDITAELADAPPPPEPPEPPPAPPPPDHRAVRWGAYMTKTLPGSALVDITDIAYGWQTRVSLQRGEHYSDITGHLKRIASIYDLPDGRVVVEPIPGAPVHQARLTVLTDSPLERTISWPGPGLDQATGTFPIAVTADGQTLSYRLWRPGEGTRHGLFAGTTGSGKSTALNLLLCEVAASDRLYPVIIDGSGGMSMPDWLPHVTHTATTPEEAIAVLEWAVGVMGAREARLARIAWIDDKDRHRVGLKSIDPTPAMPGLVIVIDEAQDLLKHPAYGPRVRWLLERLAQKGRKVAIALVLATQQPSVTELGGSSLLRNMLKSGNVIAFRTADRIAGGMVTDVALPEQLHHLPEQWPNGTSTAGLCYITTQRIVRARTWRVDDPYAHAAAMATKHLDAVSAAVPVPAVAAPAGAGPARPVPAVDLHVTTGTADTAAPDDLDDAVARVRAALDAGTPADPFALARATGLRWRTAKDALHHLGS